MTPRIGWAWLGLALATAPVLVPLPLMAQAEVRQDGLQLKVRRLPDAIELVLQDVGAGGALEQQRQGNQWLGELRTSRTRGLKAGPQSLAMPDAGMERITFDGTGRLFQLKVTPTKNGTVPPPIISSDGNDLVVRFPAPTLPIAQTAKPNLSRPTPVPAPAFVPPLRPRAVAPPVGDMAVGTMIIRNRGYINLSGPPVTLTTRGANARDVLMVLAQMGGYGFAFSEPFAEQEKETREGSGSNNRTDTREIEKKQGFIPPVTVSFRNEAYERAFNFVLLSAGLQARREGNTIVAGANILQKTIGNQISKVYRLNQSSPNGAADYLANLGARVTKTFTETIATTTGVPLGGAATSNPQTTTTTSETKVEAYGASSGPLQGLQATTDTRLGTITLFGEPDVVTIAEQYLKQLDMRQRQVALSVKILDVTLDNASEIDNSFAFRFGNNFIVNDGGRLLAAFGRNLPATADEFERPLANEYLGGVDQSLSSAASNSTSQSGSQGEAIKTTTYTFDRTDTLTDQAVTSLVNELNRSGARVQSTTQQTIDGITKFSIDIAENLSNDSSSSESASSTQSFEQLIRSFTGQSVSTRESVNYSRNNSANAANASGSLALNSFGLERVDLNAGTAVVDRKDSPTIRRRNPGLNYPDQQFFDFLQAQIVSSNTKVLAAPTLILQEGESSYSGTDAIRLSEDGRVGRSKTNEAMVRVGTQLVTSYEIKQDVNGNNFCQPVFGNAGLTFGARVDKIDDNGFVTFGLSPEISAAVGSQSVGNCGSINIINDRLLDTGMVRVRDGQTLILTGVISDSDRQVVSKWPILGDLPLIGQFFRRSSGNRTKNELVIMVTPRIIDDGQGGTYGYGYQPSTNDARRLMYGASMR